MLVRYSMNEKTRLRFAPSSTGYLHVGGLRIALHNFIPAKENHYSELKIQIKIVIKNAEQI